MGNTGKLAKSNKCDPSYFEHVNDALHSLHGSMSTRPSQQSQNCPSKQSQKSVPKKEAAQLFQ